MSPGDGMKERYEERLDRFRQAVEVERALGLRLGWIRVAVFSLGFAFYVVSDVMAGPVVVWSWGGVVAVEGTPHTNPDYRSDDDRY